MVGEVVVGEVVVGEVVGFGETVSADRAPGRRTVTKNMVSTGITYSSHATAWSHVVDGEKLTVPFSRVAYQLEGGIWAETSNARLSRPGSTPPSCRSWMP